MDIKLNFEAIAKFDEEVAYAASNEYNALFKVDLQSGECKYLKLFPNEKINGFRLFTKAICVNSKIYFVPASANNIAVYDTQINKIYNIRINLPNREIYTNYKPGSKFNGGVLFENFIFFIPCTYPGVIRLDIISERIEYFSQWVSCNEFMFRKSPLVDRDYFYIPSVLDNLVLKFNMKTCQGELLHVGSHNQGCWSMCKLGQEYWMAPKNPGPIIKWDPILDRVEEYNDYPADFVGGDFYFTQIYAKDKSIYLIPANANMAIKMNTVTKKIKKFELPFIKNDSKTSFMFMLDGSVYLKIVTDEKTAYYKIEIEDGSYDTYLFTLSENAARYYKDCLENINRTNTILKERESWNLKKYFKVVCSTG